MATELLIHLHDRSISIAPTGQRRALPDSAISLTPQQLCAAILEAAGDSRRAQPGSVVLVIPSSWCYVHRLCAAQRRPTHTTLAYALEEFLPCDVEQLTCEFIHAEKGEYVGVAVETRRLRPLLDALADADVSVERITVDVLHTAGPADTFVWCDSDHVAMLKRTPRGVADLRVLRIAPRLVADQWFEHVAQQLDAREFQQPGRPTLVAGCVEPENLERMAKLLHGQVSAEHTRARKQGTDFTLARDALASSRAALRLLRVWRRSAVAVFVALLLVAGALGFQHKRLDGERKRLSEWEAGVYAELFPGQSLPAGVALRLASERRRLEGLTLAGQPADAQPGSALELLRAIIAALPTDVQVDLQEIRIEGSAITLRGRTRDHPQAERLAAALNKLDSLQCASPRTDRLKEGGVQFFVSAQRRSAPAKVGDRKP
jgi:type II secretion system protein L